MAPPESQPRARRLLRLVTGVPFLVTVAVVAVLAVGYALAGFFLAPRLIASYVPRYAQEQLKRRAEIGEVRVNPLLFKLEIRDFRLQEADGRPLLGFDRLFVDFQLASLFRWAWTFAEVQLEGPRVDVILSADGRLNLAELADTFPQDEPAARPEPEAPRRMLLQHAVVSRGVVSFTDLSGSSPQTASLDPIDIELRDITTVPERPGPYAISATLAGGGVVGWDGEVSLVPLSSTGRLELRGFPLATAWRFVQDDIALAEPAGRLDADFTYQFAYRDRATTLKIDGLDVSVAGLSLTARGERTPLLSLERIGLTGGRGDVAGRELAVSEISLGGGRLAATMARDGTVNWQRLASSPAADAADRGAGPSTAPDAPPWRLTIGKVRLDELALSFVDQSRAAPLGVDVADLTVDLSARLESGPAGLAGTVDDLGVKLARVAVSEAAVARTPLVSLDQITVDGGRIDLAGRHLAVSRVGVTGGLTTVVRAADGSLPLLALLSSADQATTAPLLTAARAAATTATTARPFTVAVDKLELADHRLAVADRSVTPAVELDIDGIKVSLRDMRSDGKKPFPFDATFRVKQGGSFTARGQVAPDGRAASATLNLAGLNLIPFQPYVASTAAVIVRSGDVSTSGRLAYRSRRDGVAVTYTGAADVDRVIVVETATGEPLLAWTLLHAATIRFGLAPNRLQIDEVRLAGLDGRLVISKDKTINVAAVMKAAGGPADTPPPPRPAAEGPRPPAAAFPVAVERV
ncbi:MAG TPA: DUF748 domain-containing protein, partial [Methylomirabilota bacterium]|nr:DUF748 domain-containing protein [Methylomirabilota bacterium]